VREEPRTGGTDAAQRITEDAMASILNNVSALGATRQLGITGSGLQHTIERLTTGRRINRASDDAAGLGISNKLSADIRIANQGKRNANDGVSYLQVADGVLDEVTNLLTRASELAEQAKTGTISDSNRANIDSEFQNIIKTIGDIGQSTKFNGAAVFTSGAVAISVGSYSQISVTVGTISSSGNAALGLTAGTDALTDSSKATSAATSIATALNSVSTVRANLGASMQQLTAVSNSLGIQAENFTAANSQIMDANVADEVVNLTKFQILNQSGTSALSKANQSSQMILALLQ
jgi:flagellin